MTERKLAEDALKLLDEMLLKLTAHHRGSMREELTALKSRFAALPAPPIGGAANYWKAFRETQQYEFDYRESGSEIVTGIVAAAKRAKMSEKIFKRRMDLGRGAVTLTVENDALGGNIDILTITRLTR